MEMMKKIKEANAGIGISKALAGLTEEEKFITIGRYIGIDVGIYLKEMNVEELKFIDIEEIKEDLIDHCLSIIKRNAMKSCSITLDTYKDVMGMKDKIDVDKFVDGIKDATDIDELMKDFMRGDEQ